ncbi:TlpA disulfide reductase family protein [Pedobacter foliorum]|uniref:TlpA family protein disulfide reductase n=1 Tax=Pedobacter foliorum TaxID=2739058 RepID=UPI001564C01A|nr:TlpA disulfide reductase family protein [Pedobacter foliorum]NRF41784.1 TlpA family protein disulfide reductase [Pedobacter foliorum]
MKYLMFFFLSFYCIQLNAQSVSPITMEDKKMDAYLINRKPAILTILVKNLPDSIKKVDVQYTLVQLGAGFQVKKYTETDATGLSKITLDQNLPYQQIWLSVGNYLYAGIYVNEELTVTIDAGKTSNASVYMIGDGVAYSGKDGELNTVMNKNVLFKKKEKELIQDSLGSLRNSRKKYTVDSFLFKTDSIRKQLTEIDNEFIAKFPNYGWAVKNETLSEFYGNLCVAYWGNDMPDKLFKEVKNHKPYFTSNDGALYYQYLKSYTQDIKPNRLENTLKLCDSLYTEQKSDILKLYFLRSEKDSFSESYPSIINSIKTKWCKKIATDEFAKATISQKKIDSLFALSKTLEAVNIGTPLMKLPFEANLYQLDTLTNVNDFILNLKSKFSKKALIVDFWATWCAPCLSDLPFSKSLHEKNKDLAIEYVYLCTTDGSNIDVWKNRVADLQIPGTHIFVNEKIIAQLKTAFNAESGFPSYVVVDVNGKVNPKVITRMEMLDRDSIKKVAGL